MTASGPDGQPTSRRARRAALEVDARGRAVESGREGESPAVQASPQPASRRERRRSAAAPSRGSRFGRGRLDDAPPRRRSTYVDASEATFEGIDVVPDRPTGGAGIRTGVALAAIAVIVLGGAATVTSAFTGALSFAATAATAEPSPSSAVPAPTVSAGRDATSQPLIPPSVPLTAVAPAPPALCEDPVLTDALAAGDDASVIAAAGGALAFRDAVATGAAPCVRLDDPARTWVVIDKLRPLSPVDYAPAAVAAPEGVRSTAGGTVRTDAAAALSAMIAAARAAGAGELALASGYRSYTTQQDTYAYHVSNEGQEGADQGSARPGFSEHQSGLAADIIACSEVCGSLDDLAATPQGAWVAANAWEHGWIVRYEDGQTGVTGYSPEPWHLRYVGVDLARAYHDGGWRTLEEFFGLPAAPDYAG